MPKSLPRRNAVEARNRRILKGITGQSAGQNCRPGVPGACLGPKQKNPPDPIGIERAH
jgi:hypothetical protein